MFGTFSAWRRILSSGDVAGSLTTTTALVSVPLLLAAGMAIDAIRIFKDQQALNAAVDGAVLAVAASDRAQLSGITEANERSARVAELKEVARQYLAANYDPELAAGEELEVSLEIDDDAISLSARHPFPTALMGLGGIHTVKLLSEASAILPKESNSAAEIVLAMDTTGSMAGTYITSARSAAKDLLAILFDGQIESPYIKAGLVPFSGAVRLGLSDVKDAWIDKSGTTTVSRINFSGVLNNYSAWSALTGLAWNGCIEARTGSYASDDTAPGTGETLFTPYFAPDEPTICGRGCSQYYGNDYIGTTGSPNENTGLSSTSTSFSNHLARQKNHNKYSGRSITGESRSDIGPWFNCAKSAIVPLTSNRLTVEAGLDAMQAYGSTVIPEGLAWGWRVLSPTEPYTQGASYDDKKWRKILVLMTDGENDVLSAGAKINDLNGSWYNAYGYALAASANRFETTDWTKANGRLDTMMMALCDAIKAKGIEVYTIAFRITSENVLSNLKACASTADNYMYAPDGAALRARFKKIGEKVLETSLRLSR